MTPWLTGTEMTREAQIRLLCFPHAGGGASFFRPWRAAFGSDVQVCPVLLPGREARIRERPYRRMADLLPPLIEALLPELDRPYAVLGHSTGAAVGYEAVRGLIDRGVPPPLTLFASGRRAPHCPTLRPRYLLPEDEFVAAVHALGGTAAGVLDDPDLRRTFLPSLLADFELNETYGHLPGPRLTCPVTALCATDDPEVTPTEMRAWSGVTDGPFRLQTFPGDHFYLKEPPPALVATIRADLAPRAVA